MIDLPKISEHVRRKQREEWLKIVTTVSDNWLHNARHHTHYHLTACLNSKTPDGYIWLNFNSVPAEIKSGLKSLLQDVDLKKKVEKSGGTINDVAYSVVRHLVVCPDDSFAKAQRIQRYLDSPQNRRSICKSLMTLEQIKGTLKPFSEVGAWFTDGFTEDVKNAASRIVQALIETENDANLLSSALRSYGFKPKNRRDGRPIDIHRKSLMVGLRDMFFSKSRKGNRTTNSALITQIMNRLGFDVSRHNVQRDLKTAVLPDYPVSPPSNRALLFKKFHTCF